MGKMKQRQDLIATIHGSNTASEVGQKYNVPWLAFSSGRIISIFPLQESLIIKQVYREHIIILLLFFYKDELVVRGLCKQVARTTFWPHSRDWPMNRRVCREKWLRWAQWWVPAPCSEPSWNLLFFPYICQTDASDDLPPPIKRERDRLC